MARDTAAPTGDATGTDWQQECYNKAICLSKFALMFILICYIVCAFCTQQSFVIC